MLLDIKAFLNEHAVAGRLYVAYSGGVDSHVLLHVCAGVPALRSRLTAVYVHHGLQAQAQAWGEHCQHSAAGLGVSFELLRVDARARAGQSPEEAARRARYQALAALLAADDAVLVAHHQDDQLETVLLQLFRGAGVQGLAGMPVALPLGAGRMLRPLLNIPKPAIDAYALAQALCWVDDPSNQNGDFDRNFLRNALVPQLKQRWPSLAKTVARTARHCGAAQEHLAEMATAALIPVLNAADNTLHLPLLLALPEGKQALVLRQWCQRLGLKMPSEAFVGRLLAEVAMARPDSVPVLYSQGRCWRRYRDTLYCLPPPTPPLCTDLLWDTQQPTLALGDGRQLAWLRASTGIALSCWQQARVAVRFRSGGETIRLPHRQGRHSLKKLYQEAAIPPWQRALLPLLYLDDQLAAVGDTWIAADFYQEQADACIRLQVHLKQPGQLARL